MKKTFLSSTVAFIMLSCMASSPRKSLQSQLLGFWSPIDYEVTLYKIDKDSVYCVDEDPIVSMPYHIVGDSMYVDYGDEVTVKHISFREDTLVMKNQFGEVSYFVPVK